MTGIYAGGSGGTSANRMAAFETGNSTNVILFADASYVGEFYDCLNYNVATVAVLGSVASSGTIYFDLSNTADGAIYTSVPAIVADTTFSVPRPLVVVERYIRIRYVNDSVSMSGTFSMVTKYSVDQPTSLLSPLDGVVNAENPAQLVRNGTDFDLDVARQHILGQRSFFFFGFNQAVGTSWEDIHPNGGDINWLTTATKVEVLSSDAADTSTGLGVRSVELHGLSATGVDQEEIIIMNGTSAVESALTYIRVNKLHSQTCGTYGGSHQGDITCRVTGGGATVSLMTGLEGSVNTSVQYGSSEAGNGYWSVPLGKVMYITKLEVVSDISTNKTIDIALYERDGLLTTTAPFQPRRILWEESGISAGLEHNFKSHIKIKSLADIWFRCKGTATSKVEVELDFYLVNADSNGQ